VRIHGHWLKIFSFEISTHCAMSKLTETTAHTHRANFAEPESTSETEEPACWVSLKLEDWLTVLVMALLASITFANVLARYFTNQSFAWTEEFSVFLMIFLVLVAGSAAVARNRHIRIEAIADQGSAPRQRRLALLGSSMVVLLFTVIAILSARTVWDDIRFGETSPGIGIPQWWYTIWLPLVSLAIAARALGLFLRQRKQP
jgi:TRAP-type C4-dicarboxylate transport system permease small subunit